MDVPSAAQKAPEQEPAPARSRRRKRGSSSRKSEPKRKFPAKRFGKAKPKLEPAPKHEVSVAPAMTGMLAQSGFTVSTVALQPAIHSSIAANQAFSAPISTPAYPAFPGQDSAAASNLVMLPVVSVPTYESNTVPQEEEARKAQRAERNRHSAAASRQRKKRKMEELERRVAVLSR